MSSDGARTMAGAIPRGELVEIPCATHPVHLDNPEAFGRAVLDFLEGLGLMGR
jgi:pimeloyl-ACP methyl ester carboxylesterase